MANKYHIDDILRPQAKDALKHLELFARRTVEGMLHGIHKSRRKGVSTEFDHHKLYMPGDPLKHIDWKASARLDKFYVKRYLEDTALAVRIVLDRSASMLQTTDGGPSKFLVGARLAASLAYLILKEKDAVGLVMAAQDEVFWQPTRSSEAHLVRVLQALASQDAASGDGLEGCLKTLLERSERRGLVVLVSDLMFDPLPIQRQLARLAAQGHEVLIFQLRDATEEELPFNRWVEFGDLENPAVKHRIDTVPLKRIYREEYALLMQEWRDWAKKYDIHFVSERTDERVDALLSEYIAYRAELAGK